MIYWCNSSAICSLPSVICRKYSGLSIIYHLFR
nr:MAG TPA: hypothetical protein [Caudoviricetes sp.]DAQ44043.1 MAG TPA: hypothetical protein [Caudoviricetes sp.]DAR21149.1 MAG TPA: hypothetical protein [Caudoviricetes sp.]DAX37709.1 MAG TPA: hypothetical protein [Caudoviricetes sp.]DAZ20366.1 MAG TPA: hypothetical protein [Caudoviricetes sp.]